METAVPVVLKNDEISFEQLRALLYEDQAFDNVVISPGPGSPTRAEDIGMHHFLFFCIVFCQFVVTLGCNWSLELGLT